MSRFGGVGVIKNHLIYDSHKLGGFSSFIKALREKVTGTNNLS